MGNDAARLFKSTLKKRGYSLTRGRRIVFELLCNCSEPQTMRELYLRLGNSIDRASLYRTVKLFEELRIVQRLHIGWKYKLELGDNFSRHHHHISCIACGKLCEIRENAEVERLIRSIAAKNGITAERHQLEIQGHCSNCLQKRPRISQSSKPVL